MYVQLQGFGSDGFQFEKKEWGSGEGEVWSHAISEATSLFAAQEVEHERKMRSKKMRFWWWVLEVKKGFLGIGIGNGIGNWIGLKSQTSFLGFALVLTLCISLFIPKLSPSISAN